MCRKCGIVQGLSRVLQSSAFQSNLFRAKMSKQDINTMKARHTWNPTGLLVGSPRADDLTWHFHFQMNPSYLFGSFRAALRGLPGAVDSRRASGRGLGVNVFGHVDVIVQQHLLLHPPSWATGERGGGLSVPRLRQLLLASPAAAPAVSLRASGRLDAATAAVSGQEGWKRRREKVECNGNIGSRELWYSLWIRKNYSFIHH